MVRLERSRASPEVGQLLEAHRDFYRATGDGHTFHLCPPVRVGRAAQQTERGTGVGIRDDEGSAYALTCLQLDACTGHDPAHRDTSGHHRTSISRDVRQQERYATHSALD